MAFETLFATFYSFKGGVGRSLTLVNTAVELTDRGHHVIIWDLDIVGTLYPLPGNDWLAFSPDNRFACSDRGRDYLFFTDNLALYPAADLPELERRGLNEEG
jgi:cellulose biosynthesis protein BcsQ